MAAPARWKLLTALWTVYLVWGSTYLAIKLSVETLPAFLSAGTRFLLAGGLLALILALRGRSIRVTRRELASSALLGLSLLALGVGMVTLAETRIDSSIAAMIAGSVPLQVILLRTLARERVALATRLSVLVGLAGLALIVIPGGEGASSAVGLAMALSASISWSLGSFFAHRLSLPEDGFVAATWEMLSAGGFLLVLGVATGEPWSMEPAGFSLESVLAWLYLGVFGSLVAFTAYTWLLRTRTDLEGGHAPVREPDRRDRARRAAARRGDHACRRPRRRADRRLRLRRRALGERGGERRSRAIADVRGAPRTAPPEPGTNREPSCLPRPRDRGTAVGR